jgi:signal transduction histidine kinase
VSGTAEQVYDRLVKTRWRPGQQALDIAVATALMAFGVWVLAQPDAHGPMLMEVLLLPAVILPIFLRRRAPLAAVALVTAGIVVTGIPTFDQFRCGVALPPALMILFAVATREELPRALLGLALVLGGMIFLGFTDQILEDDVLGMAIFSWPLCGGIWAAGLVARSRDVVAEELAERSRMLERQREQTAQLAVEVERTRLASDLDAAARSRVREIIELAERGELLDGNAARARELFLRIEREGRESLNQMRGLLGVLRSDERGARSPRPTLAQIETLLEEARAGGRLVDLEVEGERRPLPGGVELAAYRALQHALVAVSGADGEPATVELRFLADALELEVRGFPAEGCGAEAALAAARERVTAHGGSFSADSPDALRRVLRAHLPVVAASG